MVPARNLLRRHSDSYGGWFGETKLDIHREKPPSLTSDTMADDNSRIGDGDQEEEREAGTSSKDGDDDWLQLGIGRPTPAPTVAPVGPTSSSGAQLGSLMELELFSNRPPPPSSSLGVVTPSMPLLTSSYRPWGFLNPNLTMANTPPPPPQLQYSFQRFVCPPGNSGQPSDQGGPAPGEMRVVSPTRRPQAGVWFLLQAAQNQVREPFLPQIPKSYLRIKNGRMTVRLLMKYLVNKLGLDDESEVEITCRGQPLLPLWTLQHVRDNIWCRRATMELLPDSPADHVMTLQYARTRSASHSGV